MKPSRGNFAISLAFLFYWRVEIGALQCNAFELLRPSRSAGLHNLATAVPSGCPTTTPPKCFSIGKVRNLYSTPNNPRSPKDFPKSALFSAQAANDASMGEGGGKRRGIVARLLWLFLFPLRLLIMNPLKMIAELVVDDLDDGTVEDTDGPTLLMNKIALDEMKTSSATPSKEEASGFSSGSVEKNSLKVGEGVSEANIKEAAEAPSVGVESASAKPTLGIDGSTKPKGERWAVCSPGVDLSGKWMLVVNDDFKSDYDRYLSDLGQPLLVRTVALGIVDRTTEQLSQSEDGKSLLIRGRNIRGVWDRTLVASGAEVGVHEYTPLRVPVMTADSEKVEAESWWENEGTVHVSWLRGVMKYGGGAFESRRYLDETGTNYVCESIYHPDNPDLDPSNIVWRFSRQPGSV